MQVNYLNNNRSFPNTRLRRTRMHDWSRSLTCETLLTSQDLIYPLFVYKDNSNTPTQTPIQSMPGVFRHNLASIIEQVKQAEQLGIPAIALFPQTPANLKNELGTEATNPNNLICTAVREIKKLNLNIGIICDVALDPYTTHGHDGVIYNNNIDNDKTLKILAEQALIQAQAGCDIIAPSDMQDGRVKYIREILEKNNLPNTLILSYAAKYASNFYGPFREAVGSENISKNISKNISHHNQQNIPNNKKTYQQDIGNTDEALHEVALDLQEGADLIMVKPGMPYLDIVYKVKQNFKVPTFAYQVSGEYTMLKLASNGNEDNFKKLMLESLTCFKRAGCDGILTYSALEIASILNNNLYSQLY